MMVSRQRTFRLFAQLSRMEQPAKYSEQVQPGLPMSEPLTVLPPSGECAWPSGLEREEPHSLAKPDESPDEPTQALLSNVASFPSF